MINKYYLCDLVRDCGMTKRELSEKCDMAPSSLYSLLNGNNGYVNKLEAVLAALNHELCIKVPVDDFAEFLAEQRTKNNMSINDAAKKAGISGQSLRQIEGGVNKPTFGTLQSLLNAYGYEIGVIKK